MTAAAVQEYVLQPMLETLPAPLHLRGNKQAIETALQVYRRALSHFSAAILEQAWFKVAAENQYHMWPKCADLLAAALHFEKAAKGKNEQWLEAATALLDAYVNRFMKTSACATRARAGGYEQQLRNYVTEAAWVQAQYLVGRKAVGYSATVLFQRGETSEERSDWFAKTREQAERGSLRVHVPHSLVEQWRSAAQDRSR